MSNKHVLSLTIVAGLLLIASCGQYGTETAPTEQAGPDPTVVDAAHYTAEFENDRVRVLRIAYGPGEESVMHYHPQAVGVYLTDANVEMTLPDGQTMPSPGVAGKHDFYDAGQHLPRNVGDQPLELVLVELKGGPTGPGIPADQDPVEVDPDHYMPGYENDRVRVLHIAYDAGESSVMHYHPDSVAVFLTDHAVEMTAPDGSTSEVTAAAGDAMFIPAGQHLPRNIADEAWELVLVELK